MNSEPVQCRQKKGMTMAASICKSGFDKLSSTLRNDKPTNHGICASAAFVNEDGNDKPCGICKWRGERQTWPHLWMGKGRTNRAAFVNEEERQTWPHLWMGKGRTNCPAFVDGEGNDKPGHICGWEREGQTVQHLWMERGTTNHAAFVHVNEDGTTNGKHL